MTKGKSDKRAVVEIEGPDGDSDRSGDHLAGLLINDAYETVTSSRDSHGDAVENMTHIANGWTWYLRGMGLLGPDERIPPAVSARMMEIVKLSRASVGSIDVDHDRDVAGYAGIAGACEVAEGNATQEDLTEVQDGK